MIKLLLLLPYGCKKVFACRTIFIVIATFLFTLITYSSTAQATITTVSATANWNVVDTWSTISRTGTISTSTASTTVTGVGTLFTTELHVGAKIYNTTTLLGTVSSIASNTSLTLTANATGTTSGIAYSAKRIPGALDHVVIGQANGTDVTIPTGYAAECASLTFNAGYKTLEVILAGTATLNISGNVDLNRPVGGAVNSFTINTGTVTVGGDFNFLGTTSTSSIYAKVVITTGTLSIAGNLSYNAPAGYNVLGNNIDMSGGAGTLNIGGNFTIANTGQLLPGTTSTVNFNGSAAQTIPIGVSSVKYNNINLNNTSATGATISAAITSTHVTGDISVQTGTFNNGGFAIGMATSKTFQVSNGATFIMTGTSGMVTGTTITKTFGATSTVVYGGTTQTVSGETYGHLTLTNGNGTGSVTKSSASGFSAAGNFTINTGVVFTPSATDIISGSGTLTGSGTAQVTRTAATPDFLSQYTITNRTLTNLTVEYTSTLAQSVNALNYFNLTVSGDRTTNSITFAGSGIIGVSGTFNPSATFTSGGRIMTGSTIDFNGTSAQSIPAITYDNLTASAPGTTKTAAGAIVVDGTLTINSNVTLDMVTYDLSGTLGTITNNGTIQTQSISATPIATGKTWGGDVYYNSSSAQTIMLGNYTNLNGTGGNRTLSSGTTGIAGTFTPGAGTYTITGSTIDFNGSASQTIPAFNYNNLTSSSSGARTLSSSGTIGIAGIFTPGSNSYTITASTIDFNAATAQTIPAFNYNNLTVSGTRTTNSVTFAGSGTIGIAGTFTASATFTSGGRIMTGSTIDFNGTSAQNIAEITYNNLSVSGSGTTKTASGAIVVNGTLTTNSNVTLDMSTYDLSGTLGTITNSGLIKTQSTSATPLSSGKTWDGTVEYYKSTGGQTIVAGTYNNLTGSNTSGTNTAAGAITINGTLTLNSGATLDMSTYALSGSLTSVSGTGTIKTQNTSSTPLPTGKTWAGDIFYNSSSAQTIIAGSYINLNGSGGNRTLVSAGTISISGSFTVGAGTYTVTGSTIVFSGTSAQTIPSFTFNNLTINKSSGTATLAADITVNATLTFTLGNITTSTYKVIIASGGSVSGAGQSTGWVKGNLQKYFSLTSGGSFEIGGALYYSSVSVTFASVTTAGSFIAGVTETAHPNVASSDISVKNISRYWTLSTPGSGAIVYTTATLSFNWNTADNYSPITASLESVGMYSSSTWSYPTVTGTPTTTNIQVNNITTLGDFTVGERSCTAATWTGATSTQWDLSGNWSCGGVPTSSRSVTIPGSLSNYPAINSGITATVNNITIQSGASVTVSSATLQIAGTISNSGTFTATTGTVELNGTSAQTIPASTFSTNTIKDLVINNSNGITLSGTLNITGAVTISNGSLNTGGYLILKSSSSATARIAQITSNAATPVNGNVTVERYIQGRRKYRLITSPVTTHANATLTSGQEAYSIWGNWQNQGNNAAGNTGTIITGGSSANGFDQQTTNASLYTYDESGRQYTGFSTANGKNTKYTPLKAGVAYYMFVYGDRLNAVNTSSPNYTVLSAGGTILSGDQTYNTSSTIPLTNTVGNYTMLGNPFASPIDWATVTKTNLYSTYWGWDPNLSSTGGYVTVNTTGTVTLISPFTGTTGLNQYIQSGQGFFVRTSAISPVLTIKESDKVSNNNTNAFRTTANNIPLIAVNLFDNNTRIFMDGAVAAFSNTFSNQVGKEDASKMNGSAESVSIVNGIELLSIDARQMPGKDDTLSLKMLKLTKPQYLLQIFTNQMESRNVHPYLFDTYLNTVSALSVNDTNRIVFNITSDPSSSNANRFKIVFSNKNGIPVNVNNPKSELRIFPNPIKDQKINFEISNLEQGEYIATLANPKGQQLLSRTINHQGGTLNQTISPENTLAGGIYYFRIESKNLRYSKIIFIE